MATRYYVKFNTVYISELPEEHRQVRREGFVPFSPYDAIRWDGTDRKRAEHITLGDLGRITDLGRRKHFGTYVQDLVPGHYVGQRYVKVGRGKYELQ